MSDKRLEGEIRSWDGNFGFIEFINTRGRTQSMFYSGRNIRGDWKGSRMWATSPRIPVSFRIAYRNGKSHAEDVAPIFAMSEPEDIMGYRETSELVSKTFDYGFLQRPCGDRLFIHIKDVVPGFENRWDILEPGSPVYHGVRLHEESQRWRADSVELYSYEELWAFKNESQPQPEPQVVVKAEPALVSLAPENRSKSFYQLALERRARHEILSPIKGKP
jgi:hypothetical protein